MGQIPDLPEDFTPPPGAQVFPVAFRPHLTKLDFHLATAGIEHHGAAIEVHTEEAWGEHEGISIHFHQLDPVTLAEVLRTAAHAAEVVAARYQTHMEEHHPEILDPTLVSEAAAHIAAEAARTDGN